MSADISVFVQLAVCFVYKKFSKGISSSSQSRMFIKFMVNAGFLVLFKNTTL